MQMDEPELKAWPEQRFRRGMQRAFAQAVGKITPGRRGGILARPGSGEPAEQVQPPTERRVVNGVRNAEVTVPLGEDISGDDEQVIFDRLGHAVKIRGLRQLPPPVGQRAEFLQRQMIKAQGFGGEMRLPSQTLCATATSSDAS